MRFLPFTIFPLILFNLLAFLAPGLVGEAWGNRILELTMFSGENWTLTWGDLMVVGGLAALFAEILGATRLASRAITNHLISTLVLIVYVVEFMVVGRAANSTFFILTIISLIDVLAGVVITIRLASRDVSYQPGGLPPV